uniref:Serine/threonine/tyrosine interacting like 1 n=1 Tax=Pelusios castaneus TaxID=367368 RepID=A0A8C8VKQ1_9SAUR
MAGLVLCEPTELYNILNQSTKLSRLTEPNYLCLLDARTKHEYNESHVITARRVKQNAMGEYLVPESVELECVKYCVVYDGKTSSLDDTYFDDYEEDKKDTEAGAATQCARVLEQFTRHPVRILKGGYERFTACYHFLRTQKIFWMPQELDAFQPYPVEILPAQLYMGDCKQACDQQIQKDLKIKTQVNISEETAMALGAVLVFSTLGLSRSSTAVMAFLMHSSHYPLKRAWKHVQTCKTNMRPNRGFVQQLSDWESQIYGSVITDVSEPQY